MQFVRNKIISKYKYLIKKTSLGLVGGGGSIFDSMFRIFRTKSASAEAQVNCRSERDPEVL